MLATQPKAMLRSRDPLYYYKQRLWFVETELEWWKHNFVIWAAGV